MSLLFRYFLSSILFMLFAYFSIVIFEAIIRGKIRWVKYVVPAVGCGIGLYIAHRSDFRLEF